VSDQDFGGDRLAVVHQLERVNCVGRKMDGTQQERAGVIEIDDLGTLVRFQRPPQCSDDVQSNAGASIFGSTHALSVEPRPGDRPLRLGPAF
jgi:hypothetical protein